MDIVKEFFDIKKDYLLKYSMILSESFSIDKKDTYLKKFIDTYVNAYYLEEYGTIEFKPYYEIKTSDIIILSIAITKYLYALSIISNFL